MPRRVGVGMFCLLRNRWFRSKNIRLHVLRIYASNLRMNKRVDSFFVFRRWIQAVCLLALVLPFCGCSSSAVSGYRMHSEGMAPTIPSGTSLHIDEAIYKTAAPKRHDFVAYRPSFVDRDVFVFRVVALPGEELKMTQDGLWINGKQAVHPKGLAYSTGSRDDIALKLNKDHYFLLGDNAEFAVDSRHLGPANKIQILGKVLGVEQ
jgi:signal peptidase I